eukprot:scaffold27929_cov176-Amphora_coffeaeformis.AAC.5
MSTRLFKNTKSPVNSQLFLAVKKIPNLPETVHRAFAFEFPQDKRVLSIGGFGRADSLRKIQVVHGSGQKQSIPIQGALDPNLPSNLSGFRAVVDLTDERIVLLGDGLVQKGSTARSLGRSMGIAPAHEQPFCMLYLTRTVDGMGQEEWKWGSDKTHELWTSCFAAPSERSGMRLRPNLVNAVEEIIEGVKTVGVALDEVERTWGPAASNEIVRQIADIVGFKHL